MESHRRIVHLHPIDLDAMEHVVRKRRHFAAVDDEIRQPMLTKTAKSFEKCHLVVDVPAQAERFHGVVDIVVMLQVKRGNVLEGGRPS